jgi:hypothetical protein
MASFFSFAIFIALRFFLLLVSPSSGPVEASPVSHSSTALAASSNYWVANIKRQGVAAFNSNPSTYQVYRNVQDFGAKGERFKTPGHLNEGRMDLRGSPRFIYLDRHNVKSVPRTLEYYRLTTIETQVTAARMTLMRSTVP